MIGPMNKLHAKAINKYFDRKLIDELGFKFDDEIKKINPLVGLKMAYSCDKNEYFSTIIINSAKSGDDPGFNLYIAWSTDRQSLLNFFSSNIESRHKDIVNSTACLHAEYLWDPNWKNKRSSFFGWFPFRAKGVSIKKIINNNGKIPCTIDEANEEVQPACDQAFKLVCMFVIPFFQKINYFLDKTYDDVSNELLIINNQII
jgi:hypothetical protein